MFVKSTMRDLKYLSSNMFANFNCVRKESRERDTWGIGRIVSRSDRSLDDNEKLDEDKLSERAECSICEQVSALNFPALGQAFRSFPQRQADNNSGETSLPLLDICNGTRFKNRWIGFFAHFRSYSILPRWKKNKRGCKYPRGRYPSVALTLSRALKATLPPESWTRGAWCSTDIGEKWDYPNTNKYGWEIVVSCLPVEQ